MQPNKETKETEEPNNKQTEEPTNASQSSDPELLKKLMALLNPPSRSPMDPQKKMEEYKFWKTQPVPKFGSDEAPEGSIEHKTIDMVKTDPQPLPDGFKWTTIDLESKSELNELHLLLHENYVEDQDEQFRFDYSVEFLEWALKPPGWKKEWNVGVRATDSNKLLAFISGIPCRLGVRSADVSIAEINFLCVHKRLRSKRLAPVLIKEVTRRVNLLGVWQALYTAGTLLPSPVSTCRYYHRTIDWEKLYEIGFAYLPPDSTPERQIQRYKLPTEVDFLTGYRKMTKEDLPQVHALLTSYFSHFELVQKLTPNELEHWLFGFDETKPLLHAYVVESNGAITDFVSYYGLKSSVLSSTKYPTLNAAYSFYYATDAGRTDQTLKPRLENLFKAALVSARSQGFDVFNALTLLDNPLFLESLDFGCGDGFLHYYLFNYYAKPIKGGIDKEGGLAAPGGVASIMF